MPRTTNRPPEPTADELNALIPLTEEREAEQLESQEESLTLQFSGYEWELSKETIPTLSERKQEAGLPEYVGNEFLASLDWFDVLALRGPIAMETPGGEVRDVYGAALIGNDGNRYTTIFGGTALVPVLKQIETPFRARLEARQTSRRGNPVWVFVNPK